MACAASSGAVLDDDVKVSGRPALWIAVSTAPPFVITPSNILLTSENVKRKMRACEKYLQVCIKKGTIGSMELREFQKPGRKGIG